MKLPYILLLFLYVSHVSQAMLIKNSEEKIRYCGEEKSIAQLVKLSLLNRKYGAFSVTRVVEYENGAFTKKGDLFSLTSQNIAHIEKNNFIYQPFFGYEKTRLSHGRHEAVGAFLIGTNKEVCLNHPSFTRLRSLSLRLDKSKL